MSGMNSMSVASSSLSSDIDLKNCIVLSNILSLHMSLFIKENKNTLNKYNNNYDNNKKVYESIICLKNDFM